MMKSDNKEEFSAAATSVSASSSCAAQEVFGQVIESIDGTNNETASLMTGIGQSVVSKFKERRHLGTSSAAAAAFEWSEEGIVIEI